MRHTTVSPKLFINDGYKTQVLDACALWLIVRLARPNDSNPHCRRALGSWPLLTIFVSGSEQLSARRWLKKHVPQPTNQSSPLIVCKQSSAGQWDEWFFGFAIVNRLSH